MVLVCLVLGYCEIIDFSVLCVVVFCFDLFWLVVICSSVLGVFGCCGLLCVMFFSM